MVAIGRGHCAMLDQSWGTRPFAVSARFFAMRLILLPSLLLIAAAPATPDLAAPRPVFQPDVFFAGRTEGHAELKVMLHSTKPVHVIGRGHMERGTLVLDQTVMQQGKKPEQREWRLHQVSPGRFAGTLSDATGPVAGDVAGNCLHLAYEMKGGMKVEQRIYLQPGGKTALNRMTVSKLGVTVAHLNETISKLD
ncbi:DUF3833 family protein [Sphingomonas koreensis]|nr:DUF3833 family protein [Sphingomonas koreensis]